MNVLEKILEEIKQPTNYTVMCGKHFTTIDRVEEIIRSHMDDAPDTNVGQWIPTSERLPNEEEFVKAYRRNYYCAEFIVMIEGATRPTALYYENGIWADENNNHYRVVAWQPLPKEYKGE